jgi:hypothetical protein
VLIAYLTVDEVNQELARGLTAACGIRLEVLWPRDGAPDGRFAAVVYDLDSLPPGGREAVLAALTAEPLPRPVVVHSYGLEDAQAEALRGNGVALYRQLGPEVFGQAAEAARVAEARRRPVPTEAEAGPGEALAWEPAC